MDAAYKMTGRKDRRSWLSFSSNRSNTMTITIGTGPGQASVFQASMSNSTRNGKGLRTSRNF